MDETTSTDLASGQPSTNGANGEGRDLQGKFQPGNRFGRGNPHAKAVAQFRTAMMQAVQEGDVSDVIRAMIVKAASGDVQAARLVLEYAVGRAGPIDESSEKLPHHVFVFNPDLFPTVRVDVAGGAA